MNAMPLLWRIRTLKIFKFHENSKFKDDPWGNKRTFLPQGRWVVITPRLTSLNLWHILKLIFILISERNSNPHGVESRRSQTKDGVRTRPSWFSSVVYDISPRKSEYSLKRRGKLYATAKLLTSPSWNSYHARNFSRRTTKWLERLVIPMHTQTAKYTIPHNIFWKTSWWHNGWIFRFRHGWN